jgi:nucleoid-associated protein YgaU
MTNAPPQEPILEPFPEEQTPAAEPQPAAEVSVASPKAPPVDTSAESRRRGPALVAPPQPRAHYEPPAKKAPRTYIVRQGDTLQKVSKQFYGTTKNWQRIYQANRATIKDPNRISVGMKLTIP